MTSGLELSDIECQRGARTLFSGLCVAAGPGELLRVTGANGAGKSSLLRLVCGLLLPTRGEVRWRGRPIQISREAMGRERLYLGHTAALKDDLSVLENLGFASELAGQPVSSRQAAAALAQAGLRGREHLPARALSQGQRQRVSLARLLLAGSAALWVLDEPFNALDAAATGWLAGLIGTQLERGGTVVLTSHQQVAIGSARYEQVLAL